MRPRVLIAPPNCLEAAADAKGEERPASQRQRRGVCDASLLYIGANRKYFDWLNIAKLDVECECECGGNAITVRHGTAYFCSRWKGGRENNGPRETDADGTMSSDMSMNGMICYESVAYK